MLTYPKLLTTSALFLSLLAPLTLAPPAFSATSIYTYTDDAGILILTTEFDAIPEKFRSHLTRHEFDQPADPPLPAAIDPPWPSPEARVVTAAGEYRMGDHDTRADAARLAVEAGKKDALEQVATYLESVTEVRNLDVTRDDLRSYTAGIVKVLEQTVTTRVEGETVVVRADLRAEVDPQNVVRAIAALRENESAARQLQTLRAETDQLQHRLEEASQALAAAPTPEEVQRLMAQREETLNQLQANAQASRAWTSVVYVTPGIYSFPGVAVPGVNRPFLQGKGLAPRHRGQARTQPIVPAPRTGAPLSPPAVAPGPVGSIVPPPPPRGIPSPQTPSPGPPYQLHPSHFWRPSPPNIHNAPGPTQQHPSMGTGQTGTRSGSFGGGGRFGGGQGHGGRGR